MKTYKISFNTNYKTFKITAESADIAASRISQYSQFSEYRADQRRYVYNDKVNQTKIFVKELN